VTRLGTSVWLVAVAIFAAACGEVRTPASLDQPGSQKTGLVGPATARQAVTAVPAIINPTEELQAFAPDGILRWTAVEGADAYEVLTFADAGFSELVEISRTLVSRQYQFTRLEAGRTYYVKLNSRVGGLWVQVPVATLRTASPVVKPRLINEQEELDGLHTAGILRWTPITGAETYEVWIYRDAELSVFAENSGPVRVKQYQLRTLEAGKRYYVQLYSRIGGVFHAGGALPITVVATSDRARIINPQEELDAFAEDGRLRWTAVTGASSYEVWIFANPDGSDVKERSGPLTERSYATQTLQFWTLMYFAQVNAYVNGQWQAGAPVRLTMVRKPAVARLTNAQEELEAFATTGTLRWTEVPGADRYEVWVYGNAGLGAVAESGGGSDLSYAVRRLCDEATYYVQVYARVDGAWTVGWATPLRVTEGTGAADCVPPAPEVDLTASAEEVQSGERVTLTWNAKFAANCTASDAWSGGKPIRGDETVRPFEESSRYSLVCTGPSGTSLGQVRVTVKDTPTEGTPRYRAVDLGNLGRDYYTFVHGLNNLGQAVGQSAPVGDELIQRPFLWANGVMTDLGTLGGPWGVAHAINDAGQVAGYAALPGNVSGRAFLYSAGTMRDIGTLGGTFSGAYDVNASGQVVGDSDTADGPGGSRHPFLFGGGAMTDLGTLGNRFGFARGVNDSGHVVGFVVGPYPYRNLPFLYRDGEMRSLGTLGGFDGQAYDINNAGQVVGSSSVVNLDGHAFLYTDGVMVDLGTLGGETSRAYAINEAGEVVGWAARPGPNEHSNKYAFVYSRGRMYDLNECLVEPLPSPLRLAEARDINDHSEIVAWGCDADQAYEGGRCRSFLLVPVEGD